MEEDTQHRQTVRVFECAFVVTVFRVVVHQVQFTWVGLTVDGVLTADAVIGSPVEVKLLEHVSVCESAASERRFLVVW